LEGVGKRGLTFGDGHSEDSIDGAEMYVGLRKWKVERERYEDI
jgi:hypothetical protein